MVVAAWQRAIELSLGEADVEKRTIQEGETALSGSNSFKFVLLPPQSDTIGGSQ